MARCNRCNKFLFFRTQSGYCSFCDGVIAAEQKVKKDKEREEERIRQAERDKRRKIGEKLYESGLVYLREQKDFQLAIKRFSAILRDYSDLYPESEIQLLIAEAKRCQEDKERKKKEEEEQRRKEEEQKRKKEAERRREETLRRSKEKEDQINNGGTRVSHRGLDVSPTGLYPHIPKLKEMFVAFFPEFNRRIVPDEYAWQRVNSNQPLWATDAVELKRQGKYVEACQLYFSNILLNGGITMGWASGVFKTLAVAGDIDDALAFGRAWVDKTGAGDMLAMHWITLVNLVKSKDTLDQIPGYLATISGNPSYSIDIHRTDLFTSELLFTLRGEEGPQAAERKRREEEEKRRKAEEERRRKEEQERQRRAEEERKRREEQERQRKAAEERRRREEQQRREAERQRMQAAVGSLTKVSSFHTKVVGVTYQNSDGSDRQRIIRDLVRNGGLNTGTELQLIPEPTNPYDHNCIRVVAANGQQIGNLSRDIAAQVAPQIKSGDVFRAFVSSQTGGDVGFAYGINILLERYQRQTASPSYGSTGGWSSGGGWADCDIEPIDEIARGEGFLIDDDGHWVPMPDDDDW